MKKLLFITTIYIIAGSASVKAQCSYNNSLYLTGAAPTVVGNGVVAPDTWAGEYNRVTGMQAGYTYEISTCGSTAFDSELTIYPAGGGTAVAYDDDGCGTTGGPSKILFTPLVTGDYDILLDEYPCSSSQIDMDVTISLVSTGGSGNPGSIVIPVVVHVVYKNTIENVSDAKILTQIDVLNKDFRKTNPDFNIMPAGFQGLGADMDISFCLAQFDPQGNPTTGITRTSTSVNSFSQSTEPKFTATGGHDNWDPTRYLNLWVCDLSGFLLGYATFPSSLSSDPELDGVVIDYEYFGTIDAQAPFNLGRTTTHEVGHWLNLRHIWGDAQCGDDFVSDTPTQEMPSSGCPTYPQVSCGNGPTGDLFYNYMDYSDDACLVMFTNGQKQRAAATLATVRTGLATSNGCLVGVSENKSSLKFELYPNPATVSAKINFGNISDDVQVSVHDLTGREVMQVMMNDGKNILDLSGLRKGIYIVKATTEDLKGIRKLIVQ